MQNIIFELIIPVLTVVASLILLVYLGFFTLALQNHIKTEDQRKRWRVSIIFYLGIAVFVIANILVALTRVSPSNLLTDISLLLNLVALVIFYQAIHERMESIAQGNYYIHIDKKDEKKKVK